MSESGFEKALEGVINAFSQENGSNTPDFLLASYLRGCLENWNKHVNWREDWWGRPPKLITAATSEPPTQPPSKS